MRSIVICEGRTDFLFLQHFMKSVYAWEDWKYYKDYNKDNFFEENKSLKKEKNELVIGFCGGCSKMPKALEKVLSINQFSSPTEGKFDNIIIITDQDDENSEENMLNLMNEKISLIVNYQVFLHNDAWTSVQFKDNSTNIYKTNFLFILIPPKNKGALETFLLDSISYNNSYDANIIAEGKRFVNTVDSKKKYLQRRRDLVKSEFNTYLSIRIPEMDYVKLHNVFSEVDWNNQAYIIDALSKLKDIED